jgi:hypothetical protein
MNHVRKSIVMTVTTAIAMTTALGAVAGLAEAGGGDHGGGRDRDCLGTRHLTVPGAEHLEAACLDDLTTAGTVKTGHTDPVDFAPLSVPGTINPTGVPGIQLDGYFPDTSTFNTTHGWNHDAQFVIRMPRDWNGGLVVAGPPGTRRQYASDVIISDTVLGQGYAYASTDKGNNGPMIYQDGIEPGDAIAEWNARVTELTIATKQVVEQHYHRAPKQTYIAGFSAAGYLTRWQLENRPDLYDGGIDWSGLMITPEVSPLTYLPTALTEYPQYVAGSLEAHQVLLDAGFPSSSEPIWEFSYRAFWDPIQRTLREELDPTFDGDTQAGNPFCAPGTPTCDADYDLNTRPPEVIDAFDGIALTGRIGKPLITIQGTLDTANLPAASQLYADMIKLQGRDTMARLYEIEGGSHFEGIYGRHPDLLRPMLPCFREAFGVLEQWTQHPRRSPAPASHFVARDPSADLVNTCQL